LVQTFAPTLPPLIGGDDTIERRWVPHRAIVFVADSSYAVIDLLACMTSIGGTAPTRTTRANS
jgi:hypothetical protein